MKTKEDKEDLQEQVSDVPTKQKKQPKIRWYVIFEASEDGYRANIEMGLDREGKFVARGTHYVTGFAANVRWTVLRLLAGHHPRCEKCGFDDVRALQIDHIAGGGNKLNETYDQMLEQILKEQEKGLGKRKYQVLCANCNKIKVSTNNEMHVIKPLFEELI